MGMPLLARAAALTFACCLLACLSGCKKGATSTTPVHANPVNDAIKKEEVAYRLTTRTAFNNRRFDELEQNATEVRSSKDRFGNGVWKIEEFYESLGCVESEPESMWQLHDSIHKQWIDAKPESATARIARIYFLVDYAWHARGSDYAGTVTPEGWALFGKRLAEAHQALTDSKADGGVCPVWWQVGLRIALGQQWRREDYDSFFAQAKAFEPTYWKFDTSHSRFLSLKWYGQPGEWEEAAEAAAAAPDGLGMETYTRCVLEQYANYRDVFKESQATWAKTQQGFDLMEQRYPDSLEVVHAYCRIACMVGDRPTAKRLFEHLPADGFSDIWITRDYWNQARAWAEAP